MHDVMSYTPAELSSLVVIDLVNNDQQHHDIVKGIFVCMLSKQTSNRQIHMMETGHNIVIIRSFLELGYCEV